MKIEHIDDISETCLQGYISATYDQLISAFGQPDSDGTDKTQCEWWLRIDGVICTIYDWKQYCDPRSITDWNVGGNDKKAAVLVEQSLRKKT